MIELLELAGLRLARALAVAGLGLLLVFAAATIADGLLRFFAARPIDAVRDLGGLVAALAVACCIPLVVIERGNISIRFVAAVAGPAASRVADIAASGLVLAVLLAMTWQFGKLAARAAADGASTWMLRIPTAPVWWLVAAMVAVAAGLQAVVLALCLQGRPPGRRHG